MFKLLTAAIFVTTTCVASVSAQSDTCRACNCQFNNVQVLDQLIEDKIATAMEAGTLGVTYTRWGSTSCPSSTGAQLVYAGRAAGSRNTQSGGGAEKLCLPNDPDYLPGTTGITFGSQIYGAEYQYHNGPNTDVFQRSVPCSVCYVPTRATTIMVPAKSLCPTSWTREYYGYLTSEYSGDDRPRSSYNCIDANPEIINGTSADVDVALFYYLSAVCDRAGLACPPYENDRILSCAVCTK